MSNGNNKHFGNSKRCSTRKSICFASLYQFYTRDCIAANSFFVEDGFDDYGLNFVYPDRFYLDEDGNGDDDWED